MTHIETSRLLLRPFRESDLDAYAAIVADPEVMKFIADGRPQHRAKAREFIERQIKACAEKNYCRWAVCLKDPPQTLIGFCGFGDLPDGGIDFGWRLARDQWRKGFGVESARAVLTHALENLRLEGIVATAFVENQGSVAIMERIGMQFAGDDTFNGKPIKRYIATPAPPIQPT